MVNSKEHLNHLLEELSQKNNKDKKYMIQFEIANTTDETIKSVLQEMLADLEQAEKKKKIRLSIVGVLIIVMAGLVFSIKKMKLKKQYHHLIGQLLTLRKVHQLSRQKNQKPQQNQV